MQTIGCRLKSVMLASTLLVASAAYQCAVAAPVGFEAFADGDSLVGQIPGLTFTNSTVLTAGLGLNEFEFPPHSGVNAVFDDGGAITIAFTAPVFSVGAYFNYGTALAFSAFDGGGGLLYSSSSAYGSNLGLSGEPGSSVNEFISYGNAAALIARVVVTGNPSGGSFTMDDLTFDTTGNVVPEPHVLALVLGALGFGCTPRGWLRRRNTA